ncbi:hypothetical protein BKA62DRAFT_831508 [Auriculariales sp. MPI-PUGE-AT-0066]|nr:hypothetical protein BKA62DRAFT_831508 [Auriculariales sp. MPI-PUGE-AT-0066]
MAKFTAQEVVAQFPDSVKGRTFLLTGATAPSIAAAAAVGLGTGSPKQIILVGRSIEKLQTLEEQIKQGGSGIEVLIFKLDLASNESIRAGATAILADNRVSTIDVVVTSAHVVNMERKNSIDGIEETFAIGHVGPFLLVNLLRPKIRATTGQDSGRIVNVTSGGHRLADILPNGKFDPLLETGLPYHVWMQYGQVKLSNILFTRSLVMRGFNAVSIHPGPTATLMNTNYDELMKSVATLVGSSPVKPTPGKENDMHNPPQPPQLAGGGLLQAALNPDLPNGAYVAYGEALESSKLSQDDQLAEELWQLSERLVGQKF